MSQENRTVQAKFFVTEITHHHYQRDATTVKMMPVYDDGPENKTWSQHTPAGELSMLITNPEAVAQFDLGAEYVLTFEKVVE